MPKFVRFFGNMPAEDKENMVHEILSGIDLIFQSIIELHPSNDPSICFQHAGLDTVGRDGRDAKKDMSQLFLLGYILSVDYILQI